MRSSLRSFAVAWLPVVLWASALLGCREELANDLGGGAGSDAGLTGSVCINGGNGADGLYCCQADGSDCTGDYDCCRGLCSGGVCAASDNTSCTVALGSRCAPAAACGCASDDDCCQEPTGALCALSAYSAPSKRCCLDTTGFRAAATATAAAAPAT